MHVGRTGRFVVDPALAMLAILIASLAGLADGGFLLVILAGVLPLLWLNYKSGRPA
jgi:hypothetical protein